jgi:hypothetical protein
MVEVPTYYGAHPARAIDNFQISGIRIGQYPLFISALARDHLLWRPGSINVQTITCKPL